MPFFSLNRIIFVRGIISVWPSVLVLLSVVISLLGYINEYKYMRHQSQKSIRPAKFPLKYYKHTYILYISIYSCYFKPGRTTLLMPSHVIVSILIDQADR